MYYSVKCIIFFTKSSTLFIFPDKLSCMYGSFKEYDIFVWSWNLSDVWRQDDGMSNLSEVCREKNLTVLTHLHFKLFHFLIVIGCECFLHMF